jgi:uncharacterized delta-60 repeat protein
MKLQDTTCGHFSLKMSRLPLFLFLLVIISGLSSTGFGQSGTYDTSFGNGGVSLISTPANALGSWESDSVMQFDGKIVSLMSASATPGNTVRNSLVRLTAVPGLDINGNIIPAGSVDPSFGSNGFRDIVWAGSNGGSALTVTKQSFPTATVPDERFVIAGNFPSGRNSSYLRIERYTNAGTLDSTFGVGGVASVNISETFCTSAVQPDQKILIGCNGGQLIRLNANGTPDNTFGAGSLANLGFTIRDLYALPDGRILVYGDLSQGKGINIVLARINANGSLDDGGRNDITPGDSFGSGGKSIVKLSLTQYARGMTFDPDTGNIYGVGQVQIGGTAVQNFDALIVRFNYGGQLDETFGQNGRTVLNIAGQQDMFRSITLLKSTTVPTKIIVAGEARGVNGSTNGDYLIARYEVNGILDTSFNNSGVVIKNFFGDYETAFNVYVQSDPFCNGCPKLVVTGQVYTGLPSQSRSYSGVLRLNL